MFKYEGIVLKTVDFKNNSKIVYLLTDNSIDSVWVRSVKKMNSKDKLITSVLTRVSYEKTETKGLSTLTNFEILDYYDDIKSNIDYLNHFSLIIETIYKLQINMEFDLLYPFVKYILEICNEGNYKIVTDVFLLKYLYLLGINPILDNCIVCGNTENLVEFNIERGGVLCLEHSINSTDRILIDYITKCYFTDLNNIDFEWYSGGLEKIMKYYQYHLNVKFISYNLIESLNSYNLAL